MSVIYWKMEQDPDGGGEITMTRVDDAARHDKIPDKEFVPTWIEWYGDSKLFELVAEMVLDHVSAIMTDNTRHYYGREIARALDDYPEFVGREIARLAQHRLKVYALRKIKTGLKVASYSSGKSDGSRAFRVESTDILGNFLLRALRDAGALDDKSFSRFAYRED